MKVVFTTYPCAKYHTTRVSNTNTNHERFVHSFIVKILVNMFVLAL